MNIRSMVAQAIREHLLTDTTLVGTVTDPRTGEVKIYLGIAPGDQKPPYILMNHVYGGRKYRSPRPEMDALWMVIAVTSTDQPDAEDLSSLIDTKLEGQYLVMPDDWSADQKVSHWGDFAENEESQGTQFWKVGGYYRIRASKNTF